jgi:polygalacturonase
MKRLLSSVIIFAAALCFTALAQDTRNVPEPKIPAACTKLDANLTSVFDGKFNTLAPADEPKLDTGRIQKAIDACAKGKAVVLQVHGNTNAFLSGPLQLREGVTLVVDKGATLFQTLDQSLLGPPLISVTDVSGAGVMGDGVIDGRGGEKYVGKNISAWDHAGGPLSRLIVCNHADNFTLYRITLKNSPNFHVVYNGGDGFTVWGVKIDTQQRGAPNTDGIDPGKGSKNITITHSFIRAGDDNVAIKGGGPGELTNMTVSHNHFYWGHGMSIGSETNGGVSKLRVFDLSLDGPDSGIRIKSMGTRGGLVHDVVYSDICIRNAVKRPIDITMAYASNGPVKGPSPPTFKDITLKNVRVSGGGGDPTILFDGYDHDHRAQITLDGVWLTDAANPPTPYTYKFDYADITYGAGGSNIQLPTPATDVTITGKPSEGKPESCAAMFVPFP